MKSFENSLTGTSQNLDVLVGKDAKLNLVKYSQRAIETAITQIAILYNEGEVPDFVIKQLAYARQLTNQELYILENEHLLDISSNSIVQNIQEKAYQWYQEGITNLVGVPYAPHETATQNLTQLSEYLGFGKPTMMGLPESLAQKVGNKESFLHYVEKNIPENNIPDSHVLNGDELKDESMSGYSFIEQKLSENEQMISECENLLGEEIMRGYDNFIVLRDIHSNGGDGMMRILKEPGEDLYRVKNGSGKGEEHMTIDQVLAKIDSHRRYVIGRGIEREEMGASVYFTSQTRDILDPNGNYEDEKGASKGTYSLEDLDPAFVDYFKSEVDIFAGSVHEEAILTDPTAFGFFQIDTLLPKQRELLMAQALRDAGSEFYETKAVKSQVLYGECNPRLSNWTTSVLGIANKTRNESIESVLIMLAEGQLAIQNHDYVETNLYEGVDADYYYEEMLNMIDQVRSELGNLAGITTRMVDSDVNHNLSDIGMTIWAQSMEQVDEVREAFRSYQEKYGIGKFEFPYLQKI